MEFEDAPKIVEGQEIPSKVINAGEKTLDNKGDQVEVVEHNPPFLDKLLGAICARSETIARTVDTFRLVRSVLWVASNVERAGAIKSASSAYGEKARDMGVDDKSDLQGRFRGELQEVVIAEGRAREEMDRIISRLRDMSAIKFSLLGAQLAQGEYGQPPPDDSPERLYSSWIDAPDDWSARIMQERKMQNWLRFKEQYYKGNASMVSQEDKNRLEYEEKLAAELRAQKDENKKIIEEKDRQLGYLGRVGPGKGE